MLSRARIFAAVTLLASCLAGPAAWAQAQNLEAGKSASQLFAGTCNACHKSPRGLLKTVSPGALPGFLREHYTTSSDMASQLASFLVSNGASDARQAKQGADTKQGADKQGGRRSGRPSGPQEQECAGPGSCAAGRWSHLLPKAAGRAANGWRVRESHLRKQSLQLPARRLRRPLNVAPMAAG